MIIYEEILREFEKQKVKYILVGGVAFNLLGGYRNTLDKEFHKNEKEIGQKRGFNGYKRNKNDK